MEGCGGDHPNCRHINRFFIKRLWIKLLLILAILAGFFLGAFLSHASNAEAPKPNSEEEKILQPPPPIVVVLKKTPTKTAVSKTPLIASNTISVTALQSWLEKQNSPLAPYAEQILQSQYWSLIIGICYIEQYHCSKAPGNNYWGMMKSGGGLMVFKTLPDGIAYMDAYFVKLSRTRSTVESLRGYYCASACTNWEPTVKRIKQELEHLE